MRTAMKWLPASLLAVLLFSAPAWACDVPVFRYALERWPSAPYEIYIYHCGPLSAEDQATLEKLKKAGGADFDEPVLYLADIDLAAEVEDPPGREAKAAEPQPAAEKKQPAPPPATEMQPAPPPATEMQPAPPPAAEGPSSPAPGATEMEPVPAEDLPDRTFPRYPPYTGSTLPWMVVRYPRMLEIPDNVWAGRFDAAEAAAVPDSPLRREIARRILGGEAGVFVILESGNADKDKAVAAMLDKELARLQKELRLPEPDPDGGGDPQYDTQGAPQLRVAFSAVRLARTDAAERHFVNMLVGVAEELRKAEEPVVFPIYGRGRALCALVGQQIDPDNLEDICGFLVGPCSCIFKDQNPGFDLLMSMDWDAALAGEESAIPAPAAPPLAGLSDFAAAQAPAAAEPASPRAGAALARNILLAMAGGVVVLAVVAMVLWRRGREAEN